MEEWSTHLTVTAAVATTEMIAIIDRIRIFLRFTVYFRSLNSGHQTTVA